MRRLWFYAWVLCCLPVLAVAQTFTTYMNGPSEAPDPGDVDGSGMAIIRIEGTTVHYTVFFRDIGPPNAAHIHQAPAGTPGNVVVGFSLANLADGMFSGSVSGVNQQLINDIKANPANFYVNVHNGEFPGGAIRGQLGEGCDMQSPTTLCVNNNRFRVDVAWEIPDGRIGAGQRVKLTGDTGYFWFFNPDNVELVVKVLNGCVFPDINSQLVFASGLTNVEVEFTVIDTQTGAFARYRNDQGTAFLPIQQAPFGCP